MNTGGWRSSVEQRIKPVPGVSGNHSRRPLVSIRFVAAPAGASLLSVALAVAALAAPGDQDPTFGGDGKVTTDFTRHPDAANGLDIQSDGRLVAVGFANGRNPRFALARYNSDGRLDTTFGGDGKVTTEFELGPAKAFDVAIQVDGKIVAAGVGGGTALARYNSDGTLDTAFGNGGTVTINFPGGNRANALAIQPNGQIVTAGVSHVGTEPRFAVARFNTDGSLDTTFGGDGKVTTEFELGPSQAFDVAIQVDGKIVAAGVGGGFALARYNSDGALDTSFGDDGKVRTTFGPGGTHPRAVVIQGDGAITAAGVAHVGTDSTFALARYLSN